MNSSQWKKSLQWKGKIHCIINVSLVIAIFVPKNLDVLKKIYLFLWHSLKESKNFQFLANFQLEKSLHRSEKKVQWISQYNRKWQNFAAMWGSVVCWIDLHNQEFITLLCHLVNFCWWLMTDPKIASKFCCLQYLSIAALEAIHQPYSVAIADSSGWSLKK